MLDPVIATSGIPMGNPPPPATMPERQEGTTHEPPVPRRVPHTANKAEIIRPLLEQLGFDDEHIHQALAALSGTPSAPSQPEPLLTQKELCAALKVSHTTLWRMGLPTYNVGGRKRYRLSEVLRHLNDREKAGAA